MTTWEPRPAKDAYSIDRFYTRSVDSKGHADKLHLTISPSLLSEISALVASQVISEYRTAADVVRDAVVHRMQWLSERLADDSLRRRVTMHTLADEVERHQMEKDQFQAMVSGVRTHVDYLLDHDQSVTAVEYLDKLLDHVDAVPRSLRPEYTDMLEQSMTKVRKRIG